MIISEILAWFAAICTLLLALKYITRISRTRQINRLFRKSHKLLGVLMITTGLLHGVLAGNEKSATFFDIQFMIKLFTLNLGTVCLLVALLLAFTYMFRKKLKKRWMFLHRVLTVILLVLLVLHVHEEIDNKHQESSYDLNNLVPSGIFGLI